MAEIMDQRQLALYIRQQVRRQMLPASVSLSPGMSVPFLAPPPPHTTSTFYLTANHSLCAADTILSFEIHVSYLPTIPDSPELLRKSASNYGITARGKIITEIVDYGNLVTSGNNW